MNTQLATLHRCALFMFWDAGFDSIEKLTQAREIVQKIKQAAINGNVYSDDVITAIKKQINEDKNHE